MIEAGDVVGVIAMNTALDILDRRYNSLYQQWQILGGTSDIDSITFPQVDYSHADALDEQRTREEARY
jgi:predicted NUDIX family NTP pyrophosphohydrolase